MDERALTVLEQFDLEVTRTRKGRGVYFVESPDELYVLEDYKGSEEKIERLWQLTNALERVQFFKTDIPVRSKEGTFLVKDKEETTYLLKRWTEGRECDPKNELDVCRAVEGLAIFHMAADGVWSFATEEERKKYEGPNLVETFEKRMRELKKVQNFMRRKQKKNDFEFCYLEVVPEFLAEASEIIARLKESGYEQLRKESMDTVKLCHGEFTQHNVLFDRSKVLLMNLEHACLDIPCMDLALFLRKVMEKQGWKLSVGEKLLRAYEVVRPMSAKERMTLGLCLAYPEKLWKIANHYYHSNKAWVPAKNLEKLKVFVNQQKAREQFVHKIIL